MENAVLLLFVLDACMVLLCADMIFVTIVSLSLVFFLLCLCLFLVC